MLREILGQNATGRINTKSAWTINPNLESSYDYKGEAWSVPLHFTLSKPVKLDGHSELWSGIAVLAHLARGRPTELRVPFSVTPLIPQR